MKRILLIGAGAREHAIGKAFKRSPQACELFVYAKTRNPGLLDLASGYEIGDLADLQHIAEYAEKIQADFAFVGPDNPIADGAVDALDVLGIPSVAPFKILAQLESSKSFTRNLMEKYGIFGNPEYKIFHSMEGVREFMEALGGNYVVKADGLKGGKGVKVSGEHLETLEEGLVYAEECLMEDGQVLIEEKFVGQEFSLMSFADGFSVVDMPAIQDHKRAYESDLGPNTGGMGTYSDANHSLPFLRAEDLEAAHEITVKVMEALFKETGKRYKGIMYGGFIAVKNGVRLIEYNARFGDPEAMNALSLLKTDFLEICEAILAGRLGDLTLEFEKKATVLKYLVPNGYPDNPCKGEKLEGMEPFAKAAALGGDAGLELYFASVDQKEGELFLSGSRAVAFLGKAESLARAEAIAEKAISQVEGPVFYRKDIGTEELISRRVAHMNSLRST